MGSVLVVENFSAYMVRMVVPHLERRFGTSRSIYLPRPFSDVAQRWFSLP